MNTKLKLAVDLLLLCLAVLFGFNCYAAWEMAETHQGSAKRVLWLVVVAANGIFGLLAFGLNWLVSILPHKDS